MTVSQRVIEIGKMKFDLWARYPEKEDYLFNESKSFLEIMSWVYGHLVSDKKIIPLEKISEKEKQDLKAETMRIDPLRTPEKGMQIIKAIYVLSYLSNN